jgi:hypothetical protein
MSLQSFQLNCFLTVDLSQQLCRMILSAWSEAMAPTTSPGTDDNLPPVSTPRAPVMPLLRASKRCHSSILGGETIFCLYGNMEYIFGVAPAPRNNGLAMAQHISSIFPFSPAGQRHRLLARPPHICFKGFVGGAEAWAKSTSVLNQLVCRPATPLTA